MRFRRGRGRGGFKRRGRGRRRGGFKRRGRGVRRMRIGYRM